jgi:Flp pilus assembly protein TadD
MIRSTFVILAVLAAALCGGCGGKGDAAGNNYQTVATDVHRNTDIAIAHNARAVELIAQDKLDEAEKALRAALAADVMMGPAHNNLGLVYFRQSKYYLAAWDFQYASQLMPNKAEPKNNLGMVFENVGKLDEAAEQYEQALGIDPDDARIVGNLARTYVRAGRVDARTRGLLREVVMKDGRPEWTDWARERLAIMGESTASQPAN